MDKLEIAVHPLFIVFAFILIYFGWAEVFFVYVIALVLHEYAHYFVAKMLGYKLDKLLFMPYGLQLNAKSINIKRKDEVLIALAGPMLNLLLFFVTVTIWWCYPESYNWLYTFGVANVSLALTNLIPLFPLDGGRVFVASLPTKKIKQIAIKGMRVFTIAMSIVCMILFVMSAFTKINLTYFSIAVFLISGAVPGDNDYWNLVDINKNVQVLPVQYFVVDSSVNVYNLVKYIKGNHYVIFYVISNGKIVGKFTQDQLINKINETTY